MLLSFNLYFFSIFLYIKIGINLYIKIGISFGIDIYKFDNYNCYNSGKTMRECYLQENNA